MLDLNLDPFDFDGLLASLSPPGDPLTPAKGEGLNRGDAEATPDPRPDVPPDSKRGVVYELGPHRVGCGSAGDPELVARVLGGAKLDGILMDPPYCSGGFKEAGKRSGSIGSKRKDLDGVERAPRIMGDALSSRGFAALLRGAFDAWSPRWAFVFTDWRMWVHLGDVVEASGLGIRSMIVWDKGTPGMGRGFRAQHELVMLASADGSLGEFDPKASRGNVIQCKRSGNPLHPTQKPVALLAALLGAASFMRNVGDPFGGSGSTLMAAAQAGRVAYLTELDPVFVDVIRRRWTTFAKDNGVEPGSGALV
jgi:DNA modification methylase